MIGFKYKERGLTLVEMLVAIFIFGLVVVIIASIVTNAIRVQRYNMAHRELMDQTSFVMEYMTRHIRMAKTKTAAMAALPCLSEGDNYDDSNGIEFIHYKHMPEVEDPILVCTQFYLDGGQLKERVRDGVSTSTNDLTSSGLNVQRFDVDLPPSNQPIVIISSLEIRGRENVSIEIRTSISQRDLNL